MAVTRSVERDVEDLGAEHLEGVADLADRGEHVRPVVGRGRVGQLDAAEDLRQRAGGVVDLAAGEPLDPFAGLCGLVGGVDAGPEPRVVRPVAVPVGQRRHGGDGGRRRRDLVAVEAGEHLTAQPDPRPGWHRQGGEHRDGLLHLVQRHPPRLALLVQGAHVRGEPVGGGAPGRRGRGDPSGRRDRWPRPRPARRGRPPAGRAGRAPSTSSRATRRRPCAPACRSSTRSPRPTRSSRPTTASMAARFSATKSTRLPSAAERRDQVGDGLRLAGAGRPVHDEVRAGAHRLDGLLLAAVGVEHEHVALGVVEVDPAAGRARSARPAARRGRRRAPRRRRGRRASRPARPGRRPWAAWRTRRCRRPAAGSPRSRAPPAQAAPAPRRPGRGRTWRRGWSAPRWRPRRA